MGGSLLLPAAILVLWTLVVMLWLTYARFSSIAKMKGQLPPTPVGVRGPDFDPLLSETARWSSHNYMHLLEQPTIFYPVVIVLHLAEAGSGLNIALAWGYVILRIIHSIWQITVNKLPVRMTLFTLSSLCLLALSIHAVLATMQ